jgi:hypothetical protein
MLFLVDVSVCGSILIMTDEKKKSKKKKEKKTNKKNKEHGRHRRNAVETLSGGTGGVHDAVARGGATANVYMCMCPSTTDRDSNLYPTDGSFKIRLSSSTDTFWHFLIRRIKKKKYRRIASNLNKIT